MAHFLRVEGRSFFHVLREIQKCDLMVYKQVGFKKVRILTTKEDSCKACSKLEGKVLTIEEALKTMPLPVKNT